MTICLIFDILLFRNMGSVARSRNSRRPPIFHFRNASTASWASWHWTTAAGNFGHATDAGSGGSVLIRRTVHVQYIHRIKGVSYKITKCSDQALVLHAILFFKKISTFHIHDFSCIGRVAFEWNVMRDFIHMYLRWLILINIIPEEFLLSFLDKKLNNLTYFYQAKPTILLWLIATSE